MKITTFINNVAKQAVERCLVSGLSAVILSTDELMSLTEPQICELASEPTDVLRQRKYLESRLKRLEEGTARFRAALDTEDESME